MVAACNAILYHAKAHITIIDLPIITPYACAGGKVIGCVIIIVIMNTKIAKSGDLGT